MKVVREEEERMEGDWASSQLAFISFVDDGLGVESFDPGERRCIGEAEVVGEEEDKSFVVGFGLKEEGSLFGSMLDVVIATWFVIAF